MRSVFSDDWQQSQEAHFKHIARTGTSDQRAAARQLMADIGYSEEAITALYIEATMHIDEVPDDFVPDIDVIEALRDAQHPSDCSCPSCKRK